MNNNEYNILYEKLMIDISKSVNHSINEAYENYLLEEYNMQEIFTNVSKEVTKDTKIAYKIVKKILVYVLKKLQETNQYKKALQITNEYKRRLNKYIQEHKQITPRRMLKILITVLTIYGAVSLVQDCQKLVNMINDTDNIEQVDNNIIDPNAEPVDTPEDFNIDIPKDNKELSNKTVKTSDINSATLPSKVYNNDKDYKFESSNKAREFIKKHEFCLLYPYYATASEEKEGKVTIGYGHVVTPDDGELYTKVQKLKKQHAIKQSFAYDKKNKKQIINPNHCKWTISDNKASLLFLSDIKIAEKRAFNSIMNMKDVDDNVKCYMLYNQKIKDGLTSLCYNAGSLKSDKYSFITKGLAKCRYDYKNNCIDKGDYNVSFSFFKNIKDNPSRREAEYNLFFVDANKPIKLDNNA